MQSIPEFGRGTKRHLATGDFYGLLFLRNRLPRRLHHFDTLQLELTITADLCCAAKLQSDKWPCCFRTRFFTSFEGLAVVTESVREQADLAASGDVGVSEGSLPRMLAKSHGRSAISQFLPSLSGQQFMTVSIIIDMVLVFLSFVFAKELYTWYYNGHYKILDEYIYSASLCALTYYFVAAQARNRRHWFWSSSLLRLLRSLAISFTVVLAIGFALKVSEMHSRLWFALAFVIALVLLWTKGEIIDVLAKSKRLRLPVVERIALYGSGSICRSVKTAMEAESGGFCEVSIYDQDGLASADRSTAPFSSLMMDGLNNQFNRIVLCLPAEEIPNLKSMFGTLDCLPVRIDVCAPPAGMDSLQRDFQVSPTKFLFNLNVAARSEWGMIAKRFLDFTIGALLLVLCSPIMLIAAAAIKYEDRGPVFFRQRRHGWNHSVISVWKFRTMRVLEDGEVVVQATHNDARVTRIGKLMRRTSIDELPQFFNVLNGDMSLVGPRPHAVAHNLHYSELIGSYAVRHKVKPGITGWAQIQGLRGNSEDITKMVKRAEADRWYIRNWSLLLDLKILVLTPFALLTQKDVY